MTKGVLSKVESPPVVESMKFGKVEKELSLPELKRAFSYDPITGIFQWKLPTNRRIKKGQTAGNTDKAGYSCIRFRGYKMRAHRLAWALTYGEWPDDTIDHINGNRSDNRIDNLRVVTLTTNSARNGNRAYPGVRHVPAHYAAYITIDGQTRRLGRFQFAEEAFEAYLDYGETSRGKSWRERVSDEQNYFACS